MASPSRRGGAMLLIAAAYFLTARLGLLLAMPGGNVTPVWPPSGLALAAVIVFGSRIWPGIWLGSFAANLWSFLHAPGDVPVMASIVSAAGIGAGGTAAAWLGAGNPFERVRDVCALLGLGGVAACLLSATNGILWLCGGGHASWSASGLIWLTWWLADMAGVFVFASLLLAWMLPPSFPRHARWGEACVCFGLLVAAGCAVFTGDPTRAFTGKPFTFVIIPFLVWPALRFGQRGAATTVATIACLAVWGTINGLGPFDLPTLNQSLLVLELFLSIVSLTALCIAAIAAEQSRAEVERQRVLDELEARVVRRTEALHASEHRLRTIIKTEPECVKVVSPEGRLLEMNSAGLAMLDAASLGELSAHPLPDLIAPEHRQAFGALHRQVMAGGSGSLEFETVGLKGSRRWLETHAAPLRDAAGRITALLGVTRDITERKQAEAMIACQLEVMELIASGAPLAGILDTMLRSLEEQTSGALCSIVLLDDDGIHVRHGAAPSLPDSFNRAIDGQPIGPNAGSCGTAAFRREAVIVEDIATDPLWKNYREIALSHGLRACWSTPIFDEQKRVLGTFAIYHRQPGPANEQHLRCVDMATHLAATAIVRQRDEAALLASEARYRTLVESAADAIFIARPDGRFEQVNSRACELFGYSAAEFGGLLISSVVVEAGAARQAEEFRRVMEGERLFVERNFRRKNGSVFPGELSACRTTTGLVLGIVRDITGRKRVEEERRQIFERITDAFVALDRDWRYTFVNPKAALMFGRRAEDLIGKHIWTEFPEGVGQKFHLAYEKAMARQHPAFLEEYYPPYDRWFENRIYPSPEGLTIYFHDITERKRAEAALRDLSRRLLEAEDEERRRIAKELHDSTAQDLVAVMLNLSRLRDAIPSLDAETARILEDSTALVENSANDIRTLSYVLHPPRLDEMGLPGGLVEYAAGLSKRADLRIRVDAAADFGRLPEDQEIVLFRVAQESLGNIVRHSGSDAATIRLARKDGSVVIEIEDRGRGLPPGDAARPGSGGVGIAGMRERLQYLGGRLEIESSDRGTTVRAILPLKGEPK